MGSVEFFLNRKDKLARRSKTTCSASFSSSFEYAYEKVNRTLIAPKRKLRTFEVLFNNEFIAESWMT